MKARDRDTNRVYLGAITEGRSQTQAVVAAIVEVLVFAGEQPLTPKQIHAHLKAARVPVGGLRPASTLSTMLSNYRSRFDSSSGVGWTLRPRS